MTFIHEKKLKRARFIANLLDRQFTVGGIQFGIEPLLGFIPAVGDIMGIAMGMYLYKIALEMEVPRHKRFMILVNIALDFLVGVIPFLGDIFDVFYKANVRNLHILEKHARGSIIEGETIENK